MPEPILGTSFFPGGFGLWNPERQYPLPRFPVGGIMILGHDFHSEAGYHASLKRGSESLKQPTWKNLLDVLARAGISPERCFFTNAYMGLRAGTMTTGIFPGAGDAAFVAHCRRFLISQITFQLPSIIVTLGVNAPRVLAPLSDELLKWRAVDGLRGLNNDQALIRGVTFAAIPKYSTTAVALIHPSLRHASLRHREYQGLRKDPAEIRMLKDAIQIARGREQPNTR